MLKHSHVRHTIDVRNINWANVGLRNGPKRSTSHGHMIWMGTKNCSANVSKMQNATKNFTNSDNLKNRKIRNQVSNIFSCINQYHNNTYTSPSGKFNVKLPCTASPHRQYPKKPNAIISTVTMPMPTFNTPKRRSNWSGSIIEFFKGKTSPMPSNAYTVVP